MPVPDTLRSYPAQHWQPPRSVLRYGPIAIHREATVRLPRGAKKEHIIRAALESVAYQTADVLHAMEQDAALDITALKVDGGASANGFLLQFQSDIMDVTVHRPKCIETTALGAAYLAGLAVGYWKDKEEIRANWNLDASFTAEMDEPLRRRLLKGWHRAVKCARYMGELEMQEEE